MPVRLTIRSFFCICFVALLIARPVPGLTKLEKLSTEELETISGREGLNFQLKDLRILSGYDHQIYYRPGATSTSNSSANELILENITLRETPGNSESSNSLGHDNGRVTTGTLADPITLNIRGGSNAGTDEYLRLTLPQNDASMEPNNLRVGGVLVHDEGYDAYDDFDLGRIEIRDADYTDGTKFELSGKGDGGVMIGLGIKLDGIVELDSGNGGLELNRLLAGSNCVDDGGGTCNDDDSSYWEWNFNGGLTWADLSTNRPLAFDFIGDCCTDSNRGFFMEFNPDRVNPNAGQFAVERTFIGGESYGEVWTEEVRIVNLRMRAPNKVSAEVGDNYSCNGNNSGC